MATYFHERQRLNQGDLVVVNCDYQCDVRLTDDRNFDNFRQGRRHQYYGGFYQLLPARIVVPDTGDWNITVDVGGRRETARYHIDYVKAAGRASG
jgi:hypothetical protein